MKHRVRIHSMVTGDIQAFDLYEDGRPDCFFNATRFYIKKEKELPGEWVTKRNFYATSQPDFDVEDKDSMKHRFKHQLGYVSCTLGFIYQVSVNEKPECAFEMSTVLATLCMVDPELNSMDDLNYSLNKLEADEPMEFVSDHCEQLIGVKLSNKKRKLALTYFSASLAAGYTKLLVKADNTVDYVVLDLNVAQKEYNSATGAINNVNATMNRWLFCKE